MAVTVLLLLVLTIIFGREKKTDEEKIREERKEAERNLTLEKIKSLPTVEERERVSDETGAIYISPTKDEFDKIMAVREIKDNSPIETDDFKVYFDYKTNLITVDFTDKENEGNLDLFEDWKFDKGYNIVDDEYWKINL